MFPKHQQKNNHLVKKNHTNLWCKITAFAAREKVKLAFWSKTCHVYYVPMLQ